jgi:hypothetical protein
MNTTGGSPFAEARAMLELLDKIQNSTASNGAVFTDCASGGYCGTYAKSITCTIHTNIANFSNGGRWSCVYVDSQ